MRSYKEIADIVREKGNTILEQKKKRTLCIKKFPSLFLVYVQRY